MASSDARPVPKKNTAYRHYFAIRDSVGELVTSWAGQDSKLSKDGAAFGDADNEAVEIGSSGIGYIDLTAAEMNYDAVVLKVTVTNTNALTYLVVLFPEETGDIRADAASILGTALTETSAGYLAAAVIKLFDVATPLLVASDAMRGTDNAALASVWTAARAGALTDWIDGGRLDEILDAIAADLPAKPAKNVALDNFAFIMVDATDHVSAKTGLTVTAQRSLDGAAFASCAASTRSIWRRRT